MTEKKEKKDKPPKEPKPKKPKKSLEERLDKEWLELCEYVKKEILKYPDDMKFPRQLALRLRGLQSGTFMGNKKQKPMANYSIEVIHLTFKAIKYDVLNAFSTREFSGESHKINFLMLLAECKINDIVTRLATVEKSKVKIETMELDNMANEGVEYKSKKVKEDSKNSSKINEKLKELW